MNKTVLMCMKYGGTPTYKQIRNTEMKVERLKVDKIIKSTENKQNNM